MVIEEFPLNRERARDELRIRRLADQIGQCRATTPSLPALWEVTAVSSPNCTVKARFNTSGDLCDETEHPGVHNPESASVGDTGLLGNYPDGTKFFYPGGGGDAGAPRMLIAKADMTTDDSEYNCKYLDSDGTEGDTVKCKRPNGIEVATDDVGFLGSDTDGDNMFIPAEAGIIFASEQTQDVVTNVNWDSTNTKLEQTKKQLTIDVFGRVTAIGSASTTTVDDADPCP